MKTNDQLGKIGTPVVLTVDGSKTFKNHLKAANLSRLLERAEIDIATGRTTPIRAFLRKFKRAHKISR
jgi:ribosomal protein L11